VLSFKRLVAGAFAVSFWVLSREEHDKRECGVSKLELLAIGLKIKAMPTKQDLVTCTCGGLFQSFQKASPPRPTVSH